MIKTFSYIAKASVYGSRKFVAFNNEKKVFCTAETASTAFSPENADMIATDLKVSEVRRIARDLESKGFQKVNTMDFYKTIGGNG